jgi:hypothetical protein
MPLHDWMSHLKFDRKLSELCLPGSHDAGVYKDKDAGVKPGSSTRCQYSNIWQQAMHGSRVFDIRCFLRKTGVFNKTKTPTMGHFFKEGKDGSGGDYGGTLISALEDAALFLSTHSTEFLIFRIGHTKCTGDVAEPLQQFRDKVDQKTQKMPYKSLVHRGATGNLANLQVHQLRGKLLLVFDKEFNSPNFSTDEGYYPYSKYPSIAQTGLTFCGSYSGSVGASLAPKNKDKGNWSAEGSVGIANAACQEHQNHGGGNHLLWVYWQETGGNIKINTTVKQDGMHARLDKFLSEVRDPKNNYMPNVIGHDFVNEATCRKIVKMNRDVDTHF